MAKEYVVGIDVGGTHTDAVLVHHRSKKVLTTAKTPTTKDVLSGVAQALKLVLEKDTSYKHQVSAVIIGTTTFTNAVLQLSDQLSKVTAVRLCGPASRDLPPFTDFPSELRNKVQDRVFMIDGGFEYNREVITPLDRTQLDHIVNELAQAYQGKSLASVNLVVTGLFSPVCADQETEAGQYLNERLRGRGVSELTITLSHKVGQLGLLERENAAILNASLRPLAKQTIEAFRRALKKAGLPRMLYLTQNDGTLISCREAEEYPILTFNSGAVNSLRGAGQLCGVQNGLVVDIGGTSTDFAYLLNGFPRQVAVYATIAGVRTNFRMPDTHSIALGGGSMVVLSEGTRPLQIGPTSVGYRLPMAGVCFGGQTLTTTDIVLAKGYASIPGADPSKCKVSSKDQDAVVKKMHKMIEERIDFMKADKQPLPVILVGGGSILLPPEVSFEGVSKVIRPEHFNVANAIGAALAQVSFTLEKIVNFGDQRTTILAAIRKEALELAVAQGAVRGSVEVIIDEVSLSYMQGLVRVIARAIGDLDLAQLPSDLDSEAGTPLPGETQDAPDSSDISEANIAPPRAPTLELVKDVHVDDPWMRAGGKEWVLTAEDIEAIGLGASVLGCGGGGSPYLGVLLAKQVLAQGKSLKVIKTESLKSDELAVYSAGFGVPLVVIEKLLHSNLTTDAAAMIVDYYKTLPPPNKIGALIPVEIGGLNSLIPIMTAGLLGLPIIDGDFMGRAFPDLMMTTAYIYGRKLVPLAISDDKGTGALLKSVKPHGGDTMANEIMRSLLVRMGCLAGICSYGFTRENLRAWAIPDTITKAWTLGRELQRAKALKTSPLEVYARVANASLLCVGKVVDVHRSMDRGFNQGFVELLPSDSSPGTALVKELFVDQKIVIDFQNEYLRASRVCTGKPREVLAIVPHLIVIVDNDSYLPVLAEDIKYGLRVVVIRIPAHPLLTTPEAMQIVGPTGFHLEA